MEAELDYTKSAQQNAEAYFERAKEAKRKLEGAEQAIKRLEQRMAGLEKERIVAKELHKKEEREWYERFYWFFTSEGELAIGGRSAQQNEEVVAKYFDSSDLFFHANIFGASVVVLKNGTKAGDAAKNETAQFAACFSKAWEEGLAAVDVFSAKKEQVSKSKSGGSLGTGSFLISGEREWYRNVKLELAATISKKLNIVPCTAQAAPGMRGSVALRPGKAKKSDAAKAIAKKLGYADIDYVMQHLPPGGFSLS